LLIGAYELKNHIEIPYRVVINEAVELAKSFGGVDGHRYVNGVLDKLAARLRPKSSLPANNDVVLNQISRLLSARNRRFFSSEF
jgi:hypothetical protein